MRNRRRISLLLGAIALAAGPVHAHHMVGGRVPAGLGEGLLSGLAHPVIGVDHLLALVAVGLLARGPRAPIAFVLASLVGVALPAIGILAWASEPLVALSVAALGVFLLFEVRRDDAAAVAAALAIGALHGFAYAEAIVGAETTPLVAYLAGLGLVEMAIVAAAGWVARRVTTAARVSLARVRRVSGAAIAACGVALFAGFL